MKYVGVVRHKASNIKFFTRVFELPTEWFATAHKFTDYNQCEISLKADMAAEIMQTGILPEHEYAIYVVEDWDKETPMYCHKIVNERS